MNDLLDEIENRRQATVIQFFQNPSGRVKVFADFDALNFLFLTLADGENANGD